jgi:putative ABC transport system substrate-binding protein
MNRVSDPVKAGLVSSLARPGGNVTGLSFSAVEVAPKQLQLLKEMLPRASRIGLLWYAGNPAATTGIDAIESAATRLNLHSLRFPVQTGDDFGRALKAAAGRRVEAVVVFEDIWLTKHRNEIAMLAVTHALPMVSLYKDFAEAGGLFAYGASPTAVYRRTAYYVDRILRGARPQDLPVEQPTRFDFVINLKTAKALGLTIPPSLLARADHIIE